MAKLVRTSFEGGFIPDSMTLVNGVPKARCGSNMHGWSLASFGDQGNSYETTTEVDIDLGATKTALAVSFEFCGVGNNPGTAYPTAYKPAIATENVILEFGNFKVALVNETSVDKLKVYNGVTLVNSATFITDNAIKDKWYRIDLKVVSETSAEISIFDMDRFDAIFYKSYNSTLINFVISSDTLTLRGLTGSRFSGLDNIGVNDTIGPVDTDIVGKLIGTMLPLKTTGTTKDFTISNYNQVKSSTALPGSSEKSPYASSYCPYNDLLIIASIGTGVGGSFLDVKMSDIQVYNSGNQSFTEVITGDYDTDTFNYFLGYVPFYNFILYAIQDTASAFDTPALKIYDITSGTHYNATFTPGINITMVFDPTSQFNHAGWSQLYPHGKNCILVPTTENNTVLVGVGNSYDDGAAVDTTLFSVDIIAQVGTNIISNTSVDANTITMIHFNPLDRYIYLALGSYLAYCKLPVGSLSIDTKIPLTSTQANHNYVNDFTYDISRNKYYISTNNNAVNNPHVQILTINPDFSTALSNIFSGVYYPFGQKILYCEYSDLILVTRGYTDTSTYVYLANNLAGLPVDILPSVNGGVIKNILNGLLTELPHTGEVILHYSGDNTFVNSFRTINVANYSNTALACRDSYKLKAASTGLTQNEEITLGSSTLRDNYSPVAINTKVVAAGDSANLRVGLHYDTADNLFKIVSTINTLQNYNVDGLYKDNDGVTPWTALDLTTLETYLGT